jgi:hypothetical protein
MRGQMMDYQLTLTPLLDRARRLFPNKGDRHQSGANAGALHVWPNG